MIGGALGVGTFLATAVGTRLRIRRPIALQSSGLTITAGMAVLTAIFFTLPMVALLCLLTAIFSGIAKLAVDASASRSGCRNGCGPARSPTPRPC